MNEQLYFEAHNKLKLLYGEKAEFRPGQYEAIESVIEKRRTLVVEKTGWGKSLVYFLSTKIFRERGEGVTLVISPLLVLMSNQIEAAKKLGLNCTALNCNVPKKSDNADIKTKGIILQEMQDNYYDLVLITPETLFCDDMQRVLPNINIGLFVIDEAHCISDWGHDFRLDYGRLNNVLKILSPAVPVLATTATANDRVVNDIKIQLGGDVYILRGGLKRESLIIQVIKMENKAKRYAWILKNINKIPGSGIIYCLTTKDCDYLADFLKSHDIKALSYYSRNDDSINISAEKLFMENKIKVLVATIKLGMGYDKGDISFVIHFQKPSNVVSYYQQIGRAGRNIDKAYAILLTGKEDDEILDYFIETAFPSEAEFNDIINLLKIYETLSVSELLNHINRRKKRIEKAIYFLEKEGSVIKIKTKFKLTAKKHIYDKQYYDGITKIRNIEKQQLTDFINTKQCYSKYIINCLDDNDKEDCGKCSNCAGHDIIPVDLSLEEINEAAKYINNSILEIFPRIKWAKTSETSVSTIQFINQNGICLAKYGDAGYGEFVKHDKYNKEGFRDELVNKSAEILYKLISENNIKFITFVPSLRSNIVEEFTYRLAEKTGLICLPLLIKIHSDKQKTMENSSYQCYNAFKSFSVAEIKVPDQIILVDDIVDSRWTLTVCGFKLGEKGCLKVFPFALADSSQGEN